MTPHNTPVTSQEGLREKEIDLYSILAQFAVGITDRDGELSCGIYSEEFAMKAQPILNFFHSHTEEMAKKVEGLKKEIPKRILGKEESVICDMGFNTGIDASLTIIREV